MENIDPDKARQLLAWLEAEDEQRRAERIAAGELVEVPLFIVGGSESSARAQVEQAKADKLAELRAAGDQREVVFHRELVVTGVLRPGEAADPASVPTAPAFSSREDAAIRPPPRRRRPSARGVEVTRHCGRRVEAREEPPLIETHICVQIRQCQDDDDPGEIAEGYFSVDGSTVTVTNTSGGHVGSRAMLEGEDARVVAKRLLREKKPRRARTLTAR